MSSTTTSSELATQVYEVVIKASPESIWEAITKPEFTVRYFHGARVENTPTRYRAFGPAGENWGDSPTFEFDPPRKLVHGWQSLYDPDLAAEEPSRVTWEIEPLEGGVCKLTVTHDQLEGAPKTAASVSGGWMTILNGVKTLLETGEPAA